MEQLWKSRREGSLCPLEQLRALAFRDVYKAHPEAVPEQGGLPALNSTIAGKLTLVGGGHPSKEAVRQLFERIDGDKDWYPGKRAAATYGPKPALSATARRNIAQSAMALKAAGVEPTYRNVVANCPKATLNPATGEPVSKKRISEVMKTGCYDHDPDRPWKHQKKLSRKALPVDVREKRVEWAQELLA